MGPMSGFFIRRETAAILTVWRYRYDEREHTLRLDVVTTYERPSRRHKWREVSRWSRRSPDSHATDDRPSVPDDVAVEAFERFTSMLTVER